MDAFHTHAQILNDYREYLKSFLRIRDEHILQKVEEAFESEGFIPEPLVQFNPAFVKGESLENLVAQGRVHQHLPKIFGAYQLHKHQVEALKIGVRQKGFVVTSGTGSGKSLTYLATIFNHLLQQPEKKKGVKAILVYPMNALINSQEEEINKYRDHFGADFPITYAVYTGQQGSEARESIKKNPPDIILTNYMMLELIMTRHTEEWMRISLEEHLQFLVFDELHTYRGRQGADVSLLIRRIKNLAQNKIIGIGTSATMASEGTVQEKRLKVAEVAQTIFGSPYQVGQIVGEHLQRVTRPEVVEPSEIADSITQGIETQLTEEELIHHPLARWLETHIVLRDNEGTLERGLPKTLSDMATELAGFTGLKADICHKSLVQLLKQAEKINLDLKRTGAHHSLLPFKFHQFIAQTSTVFVTLEAPQQRHITVEAGRYVKDEQNKDQLIYAVLFSRLSGVEFLCVEKDLNTRKLMPRNPDESVSSVTQEEARKKGVSEALFTRGYFLVEDPENPYWTDDDIESLPDTWFVKKDPAKGLTPYYAQQIPQPISVNKYGDFSDDPEEYPLWGWYLPARLRIDPTVGLIYDNPNTKENTKLMRLGNEGRSTATTLLSYSVIHSLHEQGDEVKNQKLLSFTDNRQDASLQAGHFNDFLSTLRLRSAVHHALQDHPNGLRVYDIPERVFEKLNLSEDLYAREPNTLEGWSDEENQKALKDYLLIRIIYDLKRGWRYTLPNLEQAGLLQIEYHRLDEFCTLPALKALPILGELSKEERKDILIQLLDFFRTSFAINHPKLSEERAELENFLHLKLDPDKLWSLDRNEKIDTPYYLVAANPGRTPRGIYTSSMGHRSTLGKYLRRETTAMSVDDYRAFIEELCDLLVQANFLKKNRAIIGSSGTVPGYQLRSDAIVWKKGDQQSVPLDKIRFTAYRDLEVKPNAFFQKLYQRDFSAYEKQITGSEHTGQLSNEDRVAREGLFREGTISSLFCSPTMELGIDIADLNIVHMRNVPPNPANYAQRSGRAGRSGQTALIFTYCSAWSPHDRNYFKEAASMVAGSVVPPRIDLKNEELIRSHFNAYLLMELGLSNLNSSVSELIEVARNLQLKESVKQSIDNGIEHYKQHWIESFKSTIAELLPKLSGFYWYTPNWLEKEVNTFYKRFDTAFDRWRTLYLNANRMRETAQIIIDDPTIKFESNEKREARTQRNIGEKQMALLTNEAGRQHGNESEFYVFRYLASEGFLPGYNFTRLPVRAFAGNRYQESGEYISRARFIALKEFGPQNLIYHNGNKYRVNRLMLADGDSKLQKIKISRQTGYAFLDEEMKAANNDPITQAALKGNNVDTPGNLLELGEVEATPQERISCEEEERMSQGFEMDRHFRYVDGIRSTRQAVIKSGDQPLLNLIFGPSTELIQLNKKWRRSVEDGFFIDKRNGKWLRQRDLENESVSENARNVILFARDWADTLYIQPVKDLEVDADQVASLSYALKRGIEKLFQVEENEIGVWVMGDPEHPNIMLYEASEGSLGILSQLIENPVKMKELFTATYAAMHFNPTTKTDTRPKLPKASYEDLLSYYNQMQHDILDRFSIKLPLERLMDCEIEKIRGSKDRKQQYDYLLSAYDKNSATELKLLEYLYHEGLALPDKAQVNMKDYYISVDFTYNTPSGTVLIFCDGSVHDQNHIKTEDAHKRELLREAGYDVVEWHYRESLEELVQRRKDIFYKVK